MQIELINNWNSYLNLIPVEKKDIYFSENYLKLYEDSDSKSECLCVVDDKNLLLLPFISRKVKDNYYDFETAYGYGGPITNSDSNEWISKALKEGIEHLKNKNFIAGFIRFHPILKNANYCRDVFNVIDDRNTVSIETEQEIASIWTNQISSKNRNMIRKAEKNGFIFEADYDFNEIDYFIKLYNETMKRLNAADFYFFDKNYYKNYISLFKNKSFLGLVKKDNCIVAAALFMYEGVYGHYHLAGSNRDFTTFGINNLLLWNATKEMHKLGVKNFHLGGGTTSSLEDSLYKFKMSFSKTYNQFSIGKLVINKNVYNEICNDWELKNPEKIDKYSKILLKYRY